MKGKIWKIILETSTILSGIGNAIKIFETTGGKNMKIDMTWLILLIIFIGCIAIILNGLRKDYQKTRQIVYQLFAGSESKKNESG
jgi:hypothetical protein